MSKAINPANMWAGEIRQVYKTGKPLKINKLNGIKLFIICYVN